MLGGHATENQVIWATRYVRSLGAHVINQCFGQSDLRISTCDSSTALNCNPYFLTTSLLSAGFAPAPTSQTRFSKCLAISSSMKPGNRSQPSNASNDRKVMITFESLEWCRPVVRVSAGFPRELYLRWAA